MRGDLTRDCLPDILRNIYLNRRSGSLRLVQDQTRKEIFFELGAMVFASSNRKEDRIGETMVRHGALSRENFDYVQSHMGRGKRFGKVLVEHGLISERDLLMNVTIQVLDIIYSLFNFTAGTYEFIEVEKTVSEDLRLNLSTASIILEGVRRVEDFDVIQRGLGNLNRLIGPSTNPLLRLQSLSLKPVERQIIDITHEPIGLLKILIAVKSPAEAVLRSLYGLLSAGVLEQFAPPVVSRISGKLEIPETLRQAMAEEELAPVIVSKRHTGSIRIDDSIVKARIDKMKELIAQGNHYLLLGVSTDVTREDLHDSYYKVAREFHPDQHQNASKEIRAEIDEIFSQITRSYDLIRNTLQQLSTTSPSPLKRTTSSSTPSIRTARMRVLMEEAEKSLEAKSGEPKAVELKPAHTPVEAAAQKKVSVPETPPPASKAAPAPQPEEKALEVKKPAVKRPTGSIKAPLAAEPTKAEATVKTEPQIKTEPPLKIEPAVKAEPAPRNPGFPLPDGFILSQPKTETIKKSAEPVNVPEQPPKPVAKPAAPVQAEPSAKSVTPVKAQAAPPPVEEPSKELEVYTEEHAKSAAKLEAKAQAAERHLAIRMEADSKRRAEQAFLDGRNRFQAQDYPSAVHLLREAVRLDPEQPRYRLLLGHVLCNNPRWHKEAEDNFRKVTEIEPNNAMAHVGLGQLYSKLGLVQRAETEFRLALKLDPDNKVARKGMQALKQGDTEQPGSTGFLSKLFSKK